MISDPNLAVRLAGTDLRFVKPHLQIHNQIQCLSVLKQPLSVCSTAIRRSSICRTPRKPITSTCHASSTVSAAFCNSSNAEVEQTSLSRLLTSVKRFADSNFITIGLLSAIVIGYLFPGPGTAAAAMNLQPVSTIAIFIISGILLQKGEMQAALKSITAISYGLASILLLTPLASFIVLRVPLQPPELALGLAVFCCMPTTLSTGVTLTNASGGNSAVALLLTVVSNMLGVCTVPLMLSLLLGAQAGGSGFAAGELFISLIKTVLIPLLFGASLQVIIPGLPQWRTTNRKKLAYLSTVFLCLVPWMQLSKASSASLPLPAHCIAAAAVTAAILHIVFLIFNITVCKFLTFSKSASENEAIRKAVVLCASEKTLPIAVAVINQLSVIGGAAVGCAVIPCILAHLIQIAIDSSLVGHWNRLAEVAVA